MKRTEVQEHNYLILLTLNLYHYKIFNKRFEFLVKRDKSRLKVLFRCRTQRGSLRRANRALTTNRALQELAPTGVERMKKLWRRLTMSRCTSRRHGSLYKEKRKKDT